MLVAGKHIQSFKGDSVLNNIPGFYNINLYCADSLASTLKILFTPKWFVAGENNTPIESPFMTLSTNSDGKFNIDKTKFTFCNEQFKRIDENGNELGLYRVINGCYCIISFNGVVLKQNVIDFGNTNSKELTFEIVR